MLREILKRILTDWPNAIREAFTNHPLAHVIRQELREAISSILAEEFPNYIISGSAGAGNWANVPWLVILNPAISKTAQDGIDIVYLFRADGTGVYLSINQGTTIPQKKYGKAQADTRASNLVNQIRAEVAGLAEWGEQQIDLRSSTALGKSYENPNIAARFYPLDALPSEAQLKIDLMTAMKFYEEIEPIWASSQNLDVSNSSSLKDIKMVCTLPKPFLLLAGISGTGKTRFVREQAAAHRGGDLTNYCLIPVRPDWHEPSDLLGYISRIGQDGARYVVTDLLRFVVSAWRDAAAFADAATLEYKSNEQMTLHWLCLDEMNLAPVEQYFADYLSVLETREWKDGKYSCDPLFKPDTMRQLDAAGLAELRGQLGLGAEHDGLWQYFVAHGISLPPNLVVAGTVNMDETTHGFSRKVIDRAFTIDFGVFYPNDFSEFFDPQTRPKTLGFPVLSHITADDLAGAAADAGGVKSIAFLGAINRVLKGSPFELAYRALNELLLAVVCFQPKDDAALRAVWDDFLMTKVLPRIDGDAEKLSADSDASLLTRLMGAIDEQFKFDGAAAQRPDLLRENRDGSVCTVNYRAKQKLDWMQKRLDANGFTTFWP
jgi:hypothetical protein